ncbi:pentapeptide repeat-containing protein [Flavobacterium sp. AS60]|uniref:pentapeptide repeat-containing protein n=1 Tax=Flavobacterium anseongense TaxID=2910677 RepID=UPI001F2E33B2|nr:pentapeptide repeat-containing protein [Flavobacterium sp. AS60]MCF6129467.1 pentapeptide repeat-containing protein [Flavobacterium sp. AS60]
MHSDYLIDQKFEDIFFLEADIKYKEYENCTFHNCDFTDCTFQSVAFIDCNFFDCNFNDTKINYVSLRGVQFTKCNFTNVNFAMTDQVIYEFNFKDCLLDYAKFYALKLKKMQFINCSMISVDFMASDLTEAVFDNCNLRRAVFIDTIANKTDFYTSYDYIIDPEKNKLKKAVFSTDGLKGLLEKYNLVIKD